MKESTEGLNQNILSHLLWGETNCNLTRFVCINLKKRAQLFKVQIQSGLITVCIGSIFLLSMYFFLIQLAEHGWQ